MFALLDHFLGNLSLKQYTWLFSASVVVIFFLSLFAFEGDLTYIFLTLLLLGGTDLFCIVFNRSLANAFAGRTIQCACIICAASLFFPTLPAIVFGFVAFLHYQRRQVILRVLQERFPHDGLDTKVRDCLWTT